MGTKTTKMAIVDQPKGVWLWLFCGVTIMTLALGKNCSCALYFKSSTSIFLPLPSSSAESVESTKLHHHCNSQTELRRTKTESCSYPHNSPWRCRSTHSTGRWWRRGGWAKSRRRRWEQWRGSARCGAAPLVSCRNVGACRSGTDRKRHVKY